jgi:hypothetical protein
MRAAMADFDRRIAAGQIQIFDHDEWYTKLAAIRPAERIQIWLSRKDEAVAAGFAGLRGSGNTSFLDERTWEDFQDYERAVDASFKDQRIVVLCSYCMDNCSADALVDIRHCHAFSLAQRHGRWDLIEMNSHDRALSALGYGQLTSWARNGRELRNVIEDQLAVYMGAYPERITLKGGQVRLSGPQATKLAILINELFIDAAKIGALATSQGKLAIQWRVVVNGSRRVRIKWTERNMMPRLTTDKISVGTQMRAGTVHNCMRTFDTTGMVCTIELDLECDAARC